MPADSFEYRNAPDTVMPPAEESAKPKPLTTAGKVKSFCNGLISPLTDPFKSPKKFLMAVGIFIAHAVIIGATGGAAAIPLLAFGLGTAVYQTAKGSYKLKHAQTDAERKKAMYELGAGIANTGLLAFGAKTALKESAHGGLKLTPEEIDKMSTAQACKESFKQLPASLRASKEAMGRGDMLQNTRSFMSRQVSETREKVQDTHHKIKNTLANREAQGWPSTIKDVLSEFLRAISFSSMLGLE